MDATRLASFNYKEGLYGRKELYNLKGEEAMPE